MRSLWVDDILRDWKAEAKVTHLILYKIRNGILTIYTDRPGVLIGFKGKLIDKFTEKLKEVPFPKIVEVKIEETDGIA